MMFCPKCGSILKPKIVHDKKMLACSCGYVHQSTGTVTFTEKKQDVVTVDIVDKEESAYPITDAECPKCKHDKAYSWHQQMRAGDEPETHFFKCTKCSHTWRDGK